MSFGAKSKGRRVENLVADILGEKRNVMSGALKIEGLDCDINYMGYKLEVKARKDEWKTVYKKLGRKYGILATFGDEGKFAIMSAARFRKTTKEGVVYPPFEHILFKWGYDTILSYFSQGDIVCIKANRKEPLVVCPIGIYDNLCAKAKPL